MKKILIIEDDSQLQDNYKTSLSNLFEIKIVDNGEDALKTAVEFLPNLILLDIILKGNLSGLSVLHDLKQSDKTHSIPVIVMSNLENQEEAMKAEGGAEYIIKSSINMKDLIEKINSYLVVT